MSAGLFILLLASSGAVSEPATGDSEPAVRAAPSEAEARDLQGAHAPTVLGSAERRQKASRAPKRRDKAPNRWDPTLKGARRGLGWGGGIALVGLGGLIVSAANSPDPYGLAGSIVAFGAVAAVGFTALATGVGALIGYRHTEAAARRHRAQMGQGETGPVSRYSFWQIPVLVGLWTHAFAYQATVNQRRYGWMADRDESSAEASSENPFESFWAPRRLSFTSANAGRTNRALVMYSTLSALLFHYARPIGSDGNRQSSWGQAGLLAVGSMVAGFSVPIANRFAHGAEGKISHRDHGVIWTRACLAAMAGLLVTDWGLSKFEGP